MTHSQSWKKTTMLQIERTTKRTNRFGSTKNQSTIFNEICFILSINFTSMRTDTSSNAVYDELKLSFPSMTLRDNAELLINRKLETVKSVVLRKAESFSSWQALTV